MQQRVTFDPRLDEKATIVQPDIPTRRAGAAITPPHAPAVVAGVRKCRRSALRLRARIAVVMLSGLVSSHGRRGRRGRWFCLTPSGCAAVLDAGGAAGQRFVGSEPRPTPLFIGSAAVQTAKRIC